MKVKKELHGATFSPDGKEIAAWAGDSIQVWDAETYKDLFTITTIFRENTQHGFCYSPDSKRIAVVGDEGPIHLWDASNGKPALSLRGHGALVTALAFTPDGKRLVSGAADGLVKVWDLAGRRELWTLRAHEGMVTSAAISPDGLTLATSGAEIKREMFGRMWGAEGQGPPSAVKLWDATAGQDGCRIDEPITAVAFSPTEPHIALAARDGHEVRIIDASCKQLRAFPAFKEQVNRLCYSPDGKSLAVALLQRAIAIDRYDVLDSVKILDADTGKPRLDLGRAGGELADVGFTPDGRWVVLGFERGQIQFRDSRTGAAGMTIPGEEGTQTHLALSPDGRRLARGNTMGTAELWEIEGEKPRLIATKKGGPCWRVSFSPDGETVAIGSGEKVNVIEAATGAERFSLGGFVGQVGGVAFHPKDGTRLAVIDARGARLWDLERKQEMLRFDGEFHEVTFRSDGQFLMALGSEGVRLWDARPPAVKVIGPTPASAAEPLPKPATEPPVDPRPSAVRDVVRRAVEQMDRDRAAALLWSVAALKADPDPTRQRLHRLRVALLLQDLPKLRPVVSAREGGMATAFLADKEAEIPTTADLGDPKYDRIWFGLLGPDGHTLARWTQGPDSRKAEERKKQGRSDYELQAFEAATGKALGPVIDTQYALGRRERVAVSPDGLRLATFAFEGQPRGFLISEDQKLLDAQLRDLRCWDATTGKPIGKPMRPDWPMSAVADFRVGFSADGRWVTFTEHEMGPRMAAWDAATGEPLHLPDSFHQLYFSPDGRRALTAWNERLAHRINKVAQVWDVENRKSVGPPIEVKAVLDACFNSDSQRVLIFEGDGFGVWDVATGRRVHEKVSANLGTSEAHLTFAPDGRRFAASEKPTTVRVRNVVTGDALTPALVLSAPCSEVRFTPDGLVLLTISDADARLWDAATGEPLTPPIAGAGSWDVWDRFTAVLSPDGSTLATRLRKGKMVYQVRRLIADDRPVEDLERLAAALSGRRIGTKGEPETIPAADLLSLRREMQTRFPAAFGSPVLRP